MSAPTRQPNFALLLVLVWLLAVLQLVAQHWVETGQTLIDTDDAMRLTQMYDWLGGRGWYDLNQPRVAPIGYEAHWSRLVDAGLAGTLWIFTRFTDAAFAERLVRTVWPALWLLVAMAGIAATVWRVAGRNGALVALVLLAVGKPAYAQFLPGRVDHHNVQIALSMLVLSATVWSDRVRWAAAAAGALTALALAIGLECLSFLVVSGAAMAFRREVWHPLNETYLFYCQDIDFCLRASKAGWDVRVIDEARVIHGLGKTIGGQDRETMRRDLLTWGKSHYGRAWWLFARVVLRVFRRT